MLRAITSPSGGGSGAHTHVEDDVTSLVTDLAAKVPNARTVSTTAPLTGGGDLSADRTLAVSDATTLAKGVVELATDGEAAANVVVQGNDSRNSNARTPTAHATSHQDAGSDEISVLGLSGLLADQQTPLTHDILTKHNGFPGGTTTFLRADGTFATPTATASDPSYSPGSFTVVTETSHSLANHVKMTGAQRITLQGTGRLSVSN